MNDEEWAAEVTRVCEAVLARTRLAQRARMALGDVGYRALIEIVMEESCP